MNPPVAQVGHVVAQEKQPDAQGLLAPPPSGPPSYQAIHPIDVNLDHPRLARRRRFWHFLACTFLFFGAMHFLSDYQASLTPPMWYSYTDDQRSYAYGPSQCADTVNWTKNPDSASPREFHAGTSFSLPLSAAVELAFVAEGALQSGRYEIAQDLDSGSKAAVVDVHVTYRVEDALDDATVCRLHPDDDTWGLGIFTPFVRHPHSHRHLTFQIVLHLPTAALDAPLLIKKLRTDLPLFSHHLPELDRSVYFDEVRLRSSNMPIQVDSLAGNNVSAKGSNAAIRGSFNTSTQLNLETTNAPITVSVNLVNGQSDTATRLTLKTSNGHIESNISLQSNTSDATKGAFDITARTNNSPLTLTVTSGPVDSSLTLHGHTSNSPARVTLHEAFEGTFDLSSSSFFRPEVQWTPVEDPKGRGRKRNVRIGTVGRGKLLGGVSWEDGGEERGKVVVETSNSPLRLNL